MVYLSWGEGQLRARSNWRHAVAVTLPIIGESNKIKLKSGGLRELNHGECLKRRGLDKATFCKIFTYSKYSKHTDQTMCHPQNWSSHLREILTIIIYRGLTGKILVSFIDGHLWKVIGYRRWSYMDIR